jgi:hypothetical protein
MFDNVHKYFNKYLLALLQNENCQQNAIKTAILLQKVLSTISLVYAIYFLLFQVSKSYIIQKVLMQIIAQLILIQLYLQWIAKTKLICIFEKKNSLNSTLTSINRVIFFILFYSYYTF